jgi:hypothetical protein
MVVVLCTYLRQVLPLTKHSKSHNVHCRPDQPLKQHNNHAWANTHEHTAIMLTEAPRDCRPAKDPKTVGSAWDVSEGTGQLSKYENLSTS